MDHSILTPLIHNAALLLAMGVVFDSLGIQNLRNYLLQRSLSGVLIGLIGLGLMFSSWEMQPGIFFDTRWILVSLCGLFFGLVPTLIAVVMMVAFRIYQGGDGFLIGSLVIVSTAALGLTCRYIDKQCNLSTRWWRLYIFGIIVEISVLCMLLLMPAEVRFKIIFAVAPTLLLIFPIVSTLLGLILHRQRERRKTDQELAQHREVLSRERRMLRNLIDAIPSHIFIKNQHGEYQGCNKAFQTYIGAPEEEIIGKTNNQLFPAVKADYLNGIEQEVLASKQAITHEYWCNLQCEQQQLLETQHRPLLNADNQIEGIVGVSRDITERQRSQERILTLSQAIEQNPVSVIITSVDGYIEYVNRAFETATGYSRSEIIDQAIEALKSEHIPEPQYASLWRALKSGQSWQGELQNTKKNGESFWEYAHVTPLFDSQNRIKHYLAVMQDISQQKAQEAKILHQAHFDSLTQLPNRFLSLDRLEQLMQDAKRHKTMVAVLFLDLDDFKKVNDTLGHETGDQLLIAATQRLCSAVRDTDTVGRLGGDEFIVLLSDLQSPQDAQPIAQKILELLRQPLSVSNRDILLTVSIGIALYPNDGMTTAELLRNADSAMYHSKAQGRNNFQYFTPELNQDAEKRLLFEEQLHHAQGNHELYLLYQPLIDIKTNRIVGAEALVRWESTTLGPIYPDQFIPVAEQTGLIVPIGYFVLETAIQQALKWQQSLCRDFKIAINLSPRQFRDPDLVGNIKSLLQAAQMPGELLELEITEGVLISQQKSVETSLTELNAAGIKISMDDFGTGYSSLSYLRSYPFDTLKIDKSFISDISIDPADLELVSAAIGMAHGLGLEVVAEGVETSDQLALLQGKRCEYAQGYYFSKPVTAEALQQMLEEQQLAATLKKD